MLDSRDKIDGKKIVMYIDGVRVEGELWEIHTWYLTVAITSPYSGLSESNGNIPAPAKAGCDFREGQDINRAYDILKSLYYLFIKVEKEIDKIRPLLDTFFKEGRAKYDKETPEMIRMNELKSELKMNKTNLKSGKIDNIQYQREIKTLKEEIYDLEFKIEDEINTLFIDSFSKFYDHKDCRVWVRTFIKLLIKKSLISDEELQFMKDNVQT